MFCAVTGRPGAKSCAAAGARRGEPLPRALSGLRVVVVVGAMSVAEATRLVMLKKPATAAMSQMSRSEKPASRSACAVGLVHRGAGGRHFSAKASIARVPVVEGGRAPVHHQHLAQRRIARQLPHRRAMGGQAVEAAVHRRDDDRDHLALELAQAAVGQHQVVVDRGEGVELGDVEGVGVQHVRHHAQLFLRRCRNTSAVGVGSGSTCGRSSAVGLSSVMLWLLSDRGNGSCPTTAMPRDA